MDQRLIEKLTEHTDNEYPQSTRRTLTVIEVPGVLFRNGAGVEDHSSIRWDGRNKRQL